MTEEVNDKCPDWAQKLIDQLRQAEILLGNIPQEEDWKSNQLKKVQEKILSSDEPTLTDHHTELIFRKIVQGLHREKFTSIEILEMINNRIGYEGGPSYCNIDEVEAEIV